MFLCNYCSAATNELPDPQEAIQPELKYCRKIKTKMETLVKRKSNPNCIYHGLIENTLPLQQLTAFLKQPCDLSWIYATRGIYFSTDCSRALSPFSVFFIGSCPCVSVCMESMSGQAAEGFRLISVKKLRVVKKKKLPFI